MTECRHIIIPEETIKTYGGQYCYTKKCESCGEYVTPMSHNWIYKDSSILIEDNTPMDFKKPFCDARFFCEKCLKERNVYGYVLDYMHAPGDKE